MQHNLRENRQQKFKRNISESREAEKLCRKEMRSSGLIGAKLEPNCPMLEPIEAGELVWHNICRDVHCGSVAVRTNWLEDITLPVIVIATSTRREEERREEIRQIIRLGIFPDQLTSHAGCRQRPLKGARPHIWHIHDILRLHMWLSTQWHCDMRKIRVKTNLVIGVAGSGYKMGGPAWPPQKV